MKIGIDLGTTFSLVSRMDPSGVVKLIPDTTYRQNLFTPSVVHIKGEFASVGQTVNSLLEKDPMLETIRFFKRHFGIAKPVYYDNMGTPWYPETIAALVLKKLKFDAEAFGSQIIEGAVITIPAHFTDAQRRAVLNAASMVGMPILGLVEEPVAAALHYGITHNSMDKVILVYDLGGGTFDVTLMSMNREGVYVIAKDGLTELGGKEFDECIGQIILDQYKKAMGVDIELNAKNLQQLRRVSEEVKVELCSPSTRYVKRLVMLGSFPLEIYITRADFEKAIANAIDETLQVMQRCVESAGLTNKDIDVVLMVGGSSMIPLIQERLQQIYGNGKVHFHDPMKAVACGAAVHVTQLDGTCEKFKIPPILQGVTGHNIGIRVMDTRTGRIKVDTLIRKNMPLPLSVTKTYYTSMPNQHRMLLDFVQFVDKNDQLINLGKLIVAPLPPQQNYPIDVTVSCHEDGTVHVLATDPRTGIEMEQTFGQGEGDENYLYAQKILVQNTIVNNIG
jgi:molecular chaperone DnaK